MKTSAIIVAAGKGKRMGKDYNKQYILLDGKPILAHTVEVFDQNSWIDEVILVVGKDEVEFVKENIIKTYKFKKITHVIEGGKERQDSVYHGLRMVSKDSDLVLIHDGARPFVTSGMIEASMEMTKEFGACVLAVPVKDTIKVVNEKMDVVHTPKRETLWAVQTPQVFKYSLLVDAYEGLDLKDVRVTDDAMLVEELGNPVKVIRGSYENIKITTPEDLILAEGILKRRRRDL